MNPGDYQIRFMEPSTPYHRHWVNWPNKFDLCSLHSAKADDAWVQVPMMEMTPPRRRHPLVDAVMAIGPANEFTPTVEDFKPRWGTGPMRMWQGRKSFYDRFVEKYGQDLVQEDVHRATAARLFGKPPSEVTDEERQIGRTVNFNRLYGST